MCQIRLMLHIQKVKLVFTLGRYYRNLIKINGLLLLEKRLLLNFLHPNTMKILAIFLQIFSTFYGYFLFQPYTSFFNFLFYYCLWRSLGLFGKRQEGRGMGGKRCNHTFFCWKEWRKDFIGGKALIYFMYPYKFLHYILCQDNLVNAFKFYKLISPIPILLILEGSES